MPEIPADLKHSADHLWVHPVDGTSLVRDAYQALAGA